MARAVEAREPHLLGHSELTSMYVVEMAKRSHRYWPWQLRRLECAALLHTIGKVGVPYVLLNSPNQATTTSDRFAIREYVRIGAAILDAVPQLQSSADAVLYHREYLDGSGFPHGRYAGSIPFDAKLLCVASEFVDLTSPRMQRAGLRAMTAQDALLYFRQQAGRKYDATVVRLLEQAHRHVAPRQARNARHES
jgi:HD-GYP domain-containing protein (c-di-GMP phosphodiesterase class II)